VLGLIAKPISLMHLSILTPTTPLPGIPVGVGGGGDLMEKSPH